MNSSDIARADNIVREADIMRKADGGREFNTVREADIVIIGGGPAGMAAAIEASHSGIKDIVILERDRSLGGILQQCVHNGFGLQLFGEELTGPEYAQRFIEQVKELGIEVKLNTMVFDITRDKVITAVNSEDGLLRIKAQAVILSMGCRERTRGALSIPGARPAGIYTAGTAQRFVNIEGYMPGKKVVILGSGDIGLIMARRMTLEGAEVKMVCELMPYSGGLKRNIVQCLDDFGIPLKLSTTVVEIHGKKRIEGVTIAKVDEKGKPVSDSFDYIECDTLLLSVGLIPENEITKAASINMDTATSGPMVDENGETSIAGIFACGNVVYVHDLVDHVTQEAYKAGKGAAEYVLGDIGRTAKTRPADDEINNANEIHEANNANMIMIKPGNGVRCVIPQYIHRDSTEDIRLFFRVGGIYRNIRLEVRTDGRVLHSVRKKIAAPGEMESIGLSGNMISGIGSDSIEIALTCCDETSSDI